MKLLRCLAPIASSLIAGCSTGFDVAAIEGSVADHVRASGETHRLRITWQCEATSFLSALFSPTGGTRCHDEDGYGSGEVNPISGHRTEHGELKRKAGVREALVPFSTASRLPAALVEPILWEIDVAASRPNRPTTTDAPASRR